MTPELYLYKAKIVRVVDGDTFDAIVDLGFHVNVKLRFRLLGVDTPEIYRPKDKTELETGRKAKEFVEDLILDKELYIRTHKTGKYGRWLAEVYLDDELEVTLSERLIEAGLVKGE